MHFQWALLLLVVLAAYFYNAPSNSESEVVPQSEQEKDIRNLPILPQDLSSLRRDSFPPLIWFAPFLSGGGYSSEAQAFAQSLSPYLGDSFSITQHGDSYNDKFVKGLHNETKLILQMLWRNHVKPTNAVVICHSEPGAWALPTPNYETSLCPPEGAAVRIGRTMFETDRLPHGWSLRLNQMDYIWVPTEFHKIIFEKGGVEPSKLVVIPEPVDTEFYTPLVAPMEYVKDEQSKWNEKNPKPYRFLSIFKWEERKGWQFLLEAYLSEFSKVDNVELWILTSAYHSDSDFNKRIQNFTKTLPIQNRSDLPTVRLLRSGISHEKMPAVYRAADSFVLPSRGEGWGRPHVEAMSAGLPVIASLWSGPSQYMTNDNSYPLSHEGFDTIKEGAFRGHKWARPNITHLKELMREVWTSRDLASIKGAKARDDMITYYCYDCVARVVLQELTRFQSVRDRRVVKSSAAGKSL